jgi:hypothetical protein
MWVHWGRRQEEALVERLPELPRALRLSVVEPDPDRNCAVLRDDLVVVGGRREDDLSVCVVSVEAVDPAVLVMAVVVPDAVDLDDRSDWLWLRGLESWVLGGDGEKILLESQVRSLLIRWGRLRRGPRWRT